MLAQTLDAFTRDYTADNLGPSAAQLEQEIPKVIEWYRSAPEGRSLESYPLPQAWSIFDKEWSQTPVGGRSAVRSERDPQMDEQTAVLRDIRQQLERGDASVTPVIPVNTSSANNVNRE